MENTWQSQCGSIWPPSTPTAASSQQLQSQESWNQMLNAGHHFYPRIVQEPHSSARGVVPEPTFPSSSTLSFYNPGHAVLASSFLSLLSGPPSALPSDLQQLSNPKPLNASIKPPINRSNVMVNYAGTRVSPTGILSQNHDNWNPKSRVDLCPVVSRPSQSSQKVRLESSTCVPRQSSTLRSGCPRVFCLGASGDLLLSNTGLLGVVCSCHGLNMSISKFSEHSGLRDVNPGDAVHMDNGETIAQWRKVYFHKFGIRVPDDHSGWDWPEGFSTSSSTTVKSGATVPNISSGALLTRQSNVEISNKPRTGQQLVDEVLRNEKQRNTQDGWNFLNSFIGTSHQIDGSPLFGCSTTSKSVGLRGPDNGYVDSISKNGNTLISFPHLQNFKSRGKDADVIRFCNSKGGGTVERPAVSSNIELRLGQPSQQSQNLGNSNLPAFGSHIITRDNYPHKSLPPEPMIHNGNYRDKEEHRQYLQFAAGTAKSNTRREKTHSNFVNNAAGIYGSTDTFQTEKLKGDLTRGSVISRLLQPKATDNVVTGKCFIPGKLLSESHNSKCDPINFIRNRSNGAETQFNVGSLGTLRHEDKGKGVEFPAAVVNFPTEFNFGFHKNQKGNQCSSATIDKNSHSYPLSDPLTVVSNTRNPFNFVGRNSSLGRISSASDAAPILPSQAVTMGVSSHMASLSVPNITPTLSNKEGVEVCPYILNGNFGMLALKHMLELSNQDHPVSPLGVIQERGNSSNVCVDKLVGSTVTDIEIQRQRPHDPCPNEHPLLRLGRSENNGNSSTGHGERCQRVQYACCEDNCSCAVHTNPLGRSAAQREVLNMKNMKKVECQAFQWRDVPSKVTSKDPPADLFDVRANPEDQIAASPSKCFNRSAQNAEFLKEQEISSISSGCSAPAITQASLKNSNEDSCTVDTWDNRRTDDLVVDESSGIDKCWSSDDRFDSERSTEFEDIASKIKSTNKGSFKAFPRQTSRSLIDELRLRDSLRSKKIRNQIHTGPTVNENSSHMPKTEKGFKIRHRKKVPKWKLLDASFPSSVVSSGRNESTDFIGADEGRSRDCACSAKPNFKRRRSAVSSSKNVSHKRNLHRLYCDKEETVGCQAQLHVNDNIFENCEQPSRGKRFKAVHVDPTVKSFWRQEPYSSSDDETNVNVCKRKARPLVCGKYGIISNGDTSKPAKLLSIKKILQNTRICDKSTSAKELKNKRKKGKKGCSDKSFNFKEEREKHDFESSDVDPDDEPYDKGLGSCSSTRLKPKNKDVRKRSLYELTTEAEGKDPSCAKFSSMKNSNCVPKTRSSYMGKFPKNTASNATEIYNASKSTELNLQSKSVSDALCCVCGSSDNQEINCLLECNICLIRVHQACYGVSKVPRAHWYCRPCKTNSKNIVCVLCGYGGGAMTQALQSHNIVKTLLKNWNFERKSIPAESLEEDQLDILPSSISVLGTDSLPFIRPEPMNSSFAPSGSVIFNSITAGVVDSSIKQWVHMVCGLWTPGTRCPNVDTMSAFDVSGAPHPKANTVCSMCNRPGGACIRCRVLDCSVLFHPWCAHQKGLLQSEVEGVDNENVGFYGRCELHATQNQHNSHHDPIQIVTNHPDEKELTCARTEGYKGRKRDGFRYNNPRKTEGGCLVPQEQVNAWVHINGLKSSAKGLPKLTHSDVEHDCRKEYARYRQSKAWKHLVVYKSGIHALGLYTSQFISRGAMVVEYMGEIVGLRVADKRESEYQSGRKLQYKSACYFFRIDKEHIIDATCKGGIARFVNHSCLPNCVAKVISVRTERKVVFFAERDIYPGEEITYDYHFNNEDEGKKIPCFCNSKSCRRYLN